MDSMDYNLLAEQLSSSDEHRVLTRLSPVIADPPEGDQDLRKAIFVDTETTGLDPSLDEIIEIGMVPFIYNAKSGEIVGTLPSFNALREPGCAITPAITEITGITPEMVSGKSIDPNDVREFMSGASLVVAHNSKFDRPFLEKFCPAFSLAPWACSLEDVPWREAGLSGGQLQSLALQSGFFYDAHRAQTDCHAAIELMRRTRLRDGTHSFLSLLTKGRTPHFRIWAISSPFSLKDILKARRYRFNYEEDGRPRAWYVDKPASEVQTEIDYLHKEIYQTDASPIVVVKIEPGDRFTNRV
ncbi:3'-5' exonuclease [Acetobacter persici]